MLTVQINKEPMAMTATPYTVKKALKQPYSVENSIKKAGYIPLTLIDKTLQGSVWKVSKNQIMFVIKVTNKALHNKHVSNLTGKEVSVAEDIIKERAILKYLSSNNPPETLAKYIDFFVDKRNYFLVQEYAGPMSLFEFVRICHEYINDGTLAIKEWHRFCKRAMNKMVDLVHWLHNTMHCCHLDLSLENFVIDKVIVIKDDTKQITFSTQFSLKLIDFGVSEVFYERNAFNEVDFSYSKNVGKIAYKAPKMYKNKFSVDARAADCWSLGVVFFIMFVGGIAYQKPSKKDKVFSMIINGNIFGVLCQWGREEYVNCTIISFLSSLLQKEKYRFTIKDIKIHPFLV